ncbi:MAG TPA: hypothetical protein VKK31_32275 [Thermoanaerobaculia bacterium]|nr:hypothetical protein [Thermoanaerobaculia bacterium]
MAANPSGRADGNRKQRGSRSLTAISVGRQGALLMDDLKYFREMGVMFTRALLLLIFLLQVSPAVAQPRPAMGQKLSEDEYRIKDLELRERAIAVEEAKTRTSLWATGIPISLALVALAGTIWAARQTVVAQFTAKAAELALQGEGSDEIINRAKLLSDLYKGLLPRTSVKRLRELDSKRLGRLVTQAPWGAELKKCVISLLAENPAQREQIIADCVSVFPGHEFLMDLPPKVSSASSGTNSIGDPPNPTAPADQKASLPGR